MPGHNTQSKLFNAGSGAAIRDPGASGTITVDRSPGYCGLISATAESRTLARPTRVGAIVTLHMKTDGGDITLTVTGGYNEDAETTFLFDDPGEFIVLVACEAGGTFFWRKIADHLTGSLSQTEAGFLNGVTAGTGAVSKAVVLDSNGSVTFPAGTAGTTEVAFDGNQLAAGGAGTAGTGTVLKTSVVKVGGIIFTSIMIDLTGLNGGGTAGDIIGTDGAGAAYLCQITAAKNGTVIGGRVTCMETPAGSNVDVDVWSANENTGVEDTAISALTGEVQLINHGNWTAGEVAGLVDFPVADQYIYLTSGAATAGTFTAGRFFIEMWGYDA